MFPARWVWATYGHFSAQSDAVILHEIRPDGQMLTSHLQARLVLGIRELGNRISNWE